MLTHPARCRRLLSHVWIGRMHDTARRCGDDPAAPLLWIAAGRSDGRVRTRPTRSWPVSLPRPAPSSYGTAAKPSGCDLPSVSITVAVPRSRPIHDWNVITLNLLLMLTEYTDAFTSLKNNKQTNSHYLVFLPFKTSRRSSQVTSIFPPSLAC